MHGGILGASRLCRGGGPSGLEILLGSRLRRVSSHGLDGDARREDSPEVHDAEEEHEQHRENEGEFDQGLAATHGPCVVAIE
jgi:hypothetical protein